MAVGYIKKVNGVNVPETTAGPGTGSAGIVAQNQNYDYDVVLTREQAGQEGFVGVSTEGSITFNPKCNIGTSEDPIYKGYLKTGVIEAECYVGVDSNTIKYNELSNNNVSYPIAIWDTVNTPSDSTNRKLYACTSSTYGITFNPSVGTLTTRNICACNYIQTSCVNVTDGTAAYVSMYFRNNTPTIYANGNLCIQNSTAMSIRFTNSNVCIPNLAGITCLCANYCIVAPSNGTYPILTRGARLNSTNYYGMSAPGDVSIRYNSTWDGSWLVAPYLELTCGYICSDSEEICIFRNNGDTEEKIEMSGGQIILCAQGDTYVEDGRLWANCGLSVCESPICTECGICSYYDISVFCPDDNSRNWYVYCDGSTCQRAGACFCSYICGNCAYVTASWNNNKCVPNMCAIRCYMYCHCMSQAYASGNTLYIRTQGNISGL